MAASDRQTADQLLLEYLAGEATAPPAAAANLVFAAMCGAEDLAGVLGGKASANPPPSPEARDKDAAPIGTYLAGIDVLGFRGIGPATRLDLIPGPGLTIVTGRNGSGKSSFAEAAELALTGDTKRWSGRSAVWRDGWRNLHTSEAARIRVRLGVEGSRGGATVECRWGLDAGLDDRVTTFQPVGAPQQPVEALGWQKPMELYRPFLSYAELGDLLTGRPSEMHDSIQRILGLGRLVEIETLLKDARKRAEDTRKVAQRSLPDLRDALAAHLDPRAREAESVLAGDDVDLDRLQTLAEVETDGDRSVAAPLRQLDGLTVPSHTEIAADVDRLQRAVARIGELAGTRSDEARRLAALLRDALSHYHRQPEQSCPVCGGRVLDASWAERVETEVALLDEQAEQIEAAHEAERDSFRALRGRLQAVPAALRQNLVSEGVQTQAALEAWELWESVVGSTDAVKVAAVALETFDDLAAVLEPVRTAVRQALERRQQAWRPAAARLSSWVAQERDARQAADVLRPLRKAISWLVATSAQIRNERLAPVVEQATAIWRTLRQESNVELDGIRLLGTGPTRRVDLQVNVDGAHSGALGVMSQGELHSLALALFLPRATIPDSPFRFLMIDDPVQSMDPAKVYGLAAVLDSVAADRQVIVFTHDDRLPTAVRQLGLQARVLSVSRLGNSRVAVSGDSDPAKRYLDDAWALARDEQIDDHIRAPVICSLIRDAIEFTCHELVRSRAVKSGARIADTEELLAELEGLRQNLALALLQDARRIADLPARLDRLHPKGAVLVGAVNRGSHGQPLNTGLSDLVANAQKFVLKLAVA